MAWTKDSRHTPEAKAKIGAASGWRHARRRRQLEVAPRHIRMLEEGDVPTRLRPLANESLAVNAELLEAKGGAGTVTPQVRILCGRAASLGLLADALALSFLQGDGRDADLATKAGSLYTQQARVLGMLGLDRFARDVDLRGYLQGKAAQAATSDTIDVVPVAQDAPDPEPASTRPAANETTEVEA